MRLRVDVDGADYMLDVRSSNGHLEYALAGTEAAGSASIKAAGPGVYSVLLGRRSLTVHIVRQADCVQVWVGGKPYRIALTDPRDRAASKVKSSAGPLEIRSQMPGKVIKLLVAAGERVESGQSLVVMEAMKMQNELRSPKDGVVGKVLAVEGATVGAGECLIVVE